MSIKFPFHWNNGQSSNVKDSKYLLNKIKRNEGNFLVYHREKEILRKNGKEEKENLYEKSHLYYNICHNPSNSLIKKKLNSKK